MSEKENEFLKAFKKWIGIFIGALSTAVIAGSVMMYNNSIRTSEQVKFIQQDIKEIRQDVRELTNKYYFVQKK